MLKEIFSRKLNTQSKTVNNAIITLGDTDDSGKGKLFKSRFIQPGLAGYPGQYGNALIKKKNLDRFIYTLRGKPVIINHKSQITDDDKVGEVHDVWFNPDDGWYWCNGLIWDETAQNLITDKGWSVSCSYCYTKCDDAGGTENNIPYDIEFLDGEFEHLAIVDNPRYEGANIVFNSKTVINNQIKEEEHPRDEKGKFTDGRGKRFKEQIKDIETGQASDKTLLNVLDKPSRVWKDAGLPDKPLVMSAGVYKKATETKHNVDKTTIERLPELIQDPLYIFKSSTQPNSFVGVLDAVENKEKSDGPLIVAIKPGQNGLEVNIITSTYGKDKDFINRELNKGNLLYKKTGVSNRKASIALKVDDLSNTIITDIQKNFNPDIKNNVQNNKEQDMALIDELKKLITKVENDKGEDMDDNKEKVENEKVDKRKLIDEVAGIMKGAGADDEKIRTAIAKMEKLAYDKSEAGTADNEKEESPKSEKDTADNSKVKNESEEDNKKYEDLKKETKEDVENKCKNSVDNAKGGYFDKMNEIYNSAIAPKEENTYISREQKLKDAEAYFTK